jgi:Tfp pilus assembly protein PilE
MGANVDIWLAASYLGMNAMTLERHYAHHRTDFQDVARSRRWRRTRTQTLDRHSQTAADAQERWTVRLAT